MVSRLSWLSSIVLCVPAVSGCLDGQRVDPLGDPLPDPSIVHGWTLILQDDSGRVWVAQSDTVVAIRLGSERKCVSVAVWSRLDAVPDTRDARLCTSYSGRQLSWSLELAGLSIAEGAGPLAMSEAYWMMQSSGRGSLTLGGPPRSVSFNVIQGLPMPDEPVTLPAPAETLPPPVGGIVSLRVDDCNAADSVSFRVLRALGLVAEFAIPSRWVGQPGRCTRRLLDDMYASGHAIEAHSRFHAKAPPDLASFYLETVGAARDLRQMGYSPRIFIQPGSWKGADASLDSPSKMRSPYGALLRRTYEAIEAYAYTQTGVGLPVTGGVGPQSMLLKDWSAAQIEQLVRQAAANGQWIQFMWHSGDQLPETLTARLSVIAVLRDSGVVAVMPFYRALHAVRRAPP